LFLFGGAGGVEPRFGGASQGEPAGKGVIAVLVPAIHALIVLERPTGS
jgi:hypothetical protein